jgi:hypothetical protein
MKRYAFRYIKERTRSGDIIYRPIAHVYLKGRNREWHLFYPYIDSGADTSMFTRSDCELLGLTLYNGTFRSMSGIGHVSIPAYIHKVLMKIGEEKFQARVAFADSNEIPRLLGRLDIFKKFRIIFDETKLYTIFETTNVPF